MLHEKQLEACQTSCRKCRSCHLSAHHIASTATWPPILDCTSAAACIVSYDHEYSRCCRKIILSCHMMSFSGRCFNKIQMTIGQWANQSSWSRLWHTHDIRTTNALITKTCEQWILMSFYFPGWCECYSWPVQKGNNSSWSRYSDWGVADHEVIEVAV